MLNDIRQIVIASKCFLSFLNHILLRAKSDSRAGSDDFRIDIFQCLRNGNVKEFFTNKFYNTDNNSGDAEEILKILLKMKAETTYSRDCKQGYTERVLEAAKKKLTDAESKQEQQQRLAREKEAKRHRAMTSIPELTYDYKSHFDTVTAQPDRDDNALMMSDSDRPDGDVDIPIQKPRPEWSSGSIVLTSVTGFQYVVLEDNVLQVHDVVSLSGIENYNTERHEKLSAMLHKRYGESKKNY